MIYKFILQFVLFFSLTASLFCNRALAPCSKFSSSSAAYNYVSALESFNESASSVILRLMKMDALTPEGKEDNVIFLDSLTKAKDNKNRDLLSLDEEINLYKDNKVSSVLFQLFDSDYLFDKLQSPQGLSFSEYQDFLKDKKDIMIEQNPFKSLEGSFLVFDSSKNSYHFNADDFLISEFREELRYNGNELIKSFAEKSIADSAILIGVLFDVLTKDDDYRMYSQIINIRFAYDEKIAALVNSFFSRVASIPHKHIISDILHNGLITEEEFLKARKDAPERLKILLDENISKTIAVLKKIIILQRNLKESNIEGFDEFLENIFNTCRAVAVGVDYEKINNVLEAIRINIKEVSNKNIIKSSFNLDITGADKHVITEVLKEKNDSVERKKDEILNKYHVMEHFNDFINSSRTSVENVQTANYVDANYKVKLLSGELNGQNIKMLVMKSSYHGYNQYECSVCFEGADDKGIFKFYALDNINENYELVNRLNKFFAELKTENQVDSSDLVLHTPILRNNFNEHVFNRYLRERPLWLYFVSRCHNLLSRIDTYHEYHLIPRDISDSGKKASLTPSTKAIVGNIDAFIHELTHAYYDLTNSIEKNKIRDFFKSNQDLFLSLKKSILKNDAYKAALSEGKSEEELYEGLIDEMLARHLENIIDLNENSNTKKFNIRNLFYDIRHQTLNFLEKMDLIPGRADNDEHYQVGGWKEKNIKTISARLKTFSQRFIASKKNSFEEMMANMRDLMKDVGIYKDFVEATLKNLQAIEFSGEDIDGDKNMQLLIDDEQELDNINALNDANESLSQMHLRMMKRNMVVLQDLINRQLPIAQIPIEMKHKQLSFYEYYQLLNKNDDINKSA